MDDTTRRSEDPGALAEEVRALAAERDAIILAHTYQMPEVQDVADHVGDSLALARLAASAEASVIVLAGVHFMAETAKILAPDKTVLLPEIGAGCPMADMLSAEQLAVWREENPGVPVVNYVNTTAAVKAATDVCCTSANAVEVVRALGAERVLFGPDRNLAAYIAAMLPEVDVIPWDGCCPVHDRVRAADVLAAKEAHPDAEVIAHPECRPEVLELADAVLSTSGMLRHVASSAAEEFVVVTEEGIRHGLAKAAPGKRFHTVEPLMVCPNMKKTSLASVRDALALMRYPIDVPAHVRDAALGAVERMVSIG